MYKAFLISLLSIFLFACQEPASDSPRAVAQLFAHAIYSGDVDKALRYMHDQNRDVLATWKKHFSSNDYRIQQEAIAQQGGIQTVNVERFTLANQGKNATVALIIISKDNHEYSFNVHLIKQGNAWKVRPWLF